MQNVFVSQEACLEFHIELRKIVIKEILQYGDVENVDLADLLSNVLFGVDTIFTD